VTSDAPRLFFNSKGGDDRISVLPNDEKYLISKDEGVYVYDLAAIRAEAGFVHLNAIKASAWNTKIVVSDMKLTLAEKTTYDITVFAAENGTVTADVEKAAEGDKVTLTITPAEGYELDELSVAAGETAVEVAEDNTFTMPAAAVTVTATFKAKESGEEPEPAPELAYTDLAKEMFFQWSDWTNGEATAQANCEYKIGESTGQPYGDPSVNNYVDLSEYATLEVTATEGTPRFLFNRDMTEGQWSETEADSHLIDNTKGGWSAKYFTSVDNGDGTTTYVVDIAALVADKGYAHLHAIKGANFANVTVSDMKLGYVGEEPVIPVPTNIFEVAEDAALKDGKYFIDGQIVIVKGGKKYTVNGVELK
jgi:hypothetical protein